MQKNNTEEEIPLLPWFETVLLETPEDRRTGWVFNPQSLQGKCNRPVTIDRVNVDWVGRVISKIGKKAGVKVDDGDERTKRPPKFASAHDLRRSCADRLEAAEVPEKIICRVLRHASYVTTRKHYSPGNVQREAGMLRKILAPTPAANLGTVLGTVGEVV
jgi:integrase